MQNKPDIICSYVPFSYLYNRERNIVQTLRLNNMKNIRTMPNETQKQAHERMFNFWMDKANRNGLNESKKYKCIIRANSHKF